MTLFFYIFASMIILSSVGTIASRNAVHSVLWLIFAFCNTAGLFVLLSAEFLAMTVVIVYVGAVAVLFLFVVMMLGGGAIETTKESKRGLLGGIILLGIFMFDLILVAFASSSANEMTALSVTPISDDISNTEAIGNILYTDFMLPFQIAGLILFVAMVGSITLTLRVRSGVRRQKPMDQLERNKENGMAVMKVIIGKGVDIE